MVDIVPGSERDFLVDSLVEPPPPPGAFKRGLGAGVAGLKSSLYGAGALAAHGAAAVLPAAAAPIAQNLEAAALENVKTQNDLAASQSMSYEDVLADPSRSAEYFKFLLGQAVPSLAIMATGGGLGALAGRAAIGQAGVAAARATGVVAPAVRAGALAGAVIPDVAMEAGSIYPEALSTGVENPAARALAGGAVAGAMDFVPLLAAEKYLKPVGRGGLGALAKGAAKGAPVGAALEGSQELVQSVIERAAAGKSLTDPEAVSDYIGSFLGGAAPGSIFGAGIGARRSSAAPVQETPPSTIPEQPPAVNVPESGMIDPNLGTPPVDTTPLPTATPAEMGDYHAAQYLEATNQIAALEPQITQAQAAHDDAVTRRDALAEELKLPVGERRTKSEILTERKELNKSINSLKTQVETLGGQLHSTRTAMADLVPRMEAAARLVVGESGGQVEPTSSSPEIVPTEQPISYKGENTVEMSPEKFLSLAMPFGEQGGPQVDTAKVAKLAAIPQWDTTPMLSVKEGADGKLQVGIHDGRHRALAAIQRGQKTITVEIARGKKLARENPALTDAQVAERVSREGLLGENAAPTVEQQTTRAVEGARIAAGEAPTQPTDTHRSDFTALANAVASTSLQKVTPAKAQVFVDRAMKAFESTVAEVKGLAPEVARKVAETNARKLKGIGEEGRQVFVDKVVEATGGKTQYSKGAKEVPMGVWNENADRLVPRGEVIWTSVGKLGSSASVGKKPGVATVKRVTGGFIARLPGWQWKVTPDMPTARFAQVPGGKIENTPSKFFKTEKLARAEIERILSPKQESHAALTQDEFDTLPEPAKYAAVDEFNRVMTAKGTALRQRITQMLGPRAGLIVKTFMATPDSPIGSYTRVSPIKAVIAMALNAKDGLSIADHEGYHAAEDSVLTTAEVRIIANALKAGRPAYEQLMAKVRAYDLANKTNLADEVSGVPAEARAYAFEFWRRGELQAEGPLARAWQKIRQFFERVANAVNGLGFKSMEDIFVALDRGQFAERHVSSGEISEPAGELQTQSSKSADYTQTPAFKKWFGDSKVVDAAGKPRTMYHGTGVWDNGKKQLGDITTFNPRASAEIVGRSPSMDVIGSWFTELPEQANTYAPKDGAVYPVYLKIENPIPFRSFDEFLRWGQKADPKWKAKITSKTESGRTIKYDRPAGAFDARHLQAKLIAAGYDGIVFTRDAAVDGSPVDTWVAFHPTQIKSAIGNTGAFDPNNPDIRFSQAAQSEYPKYTPPLSDAYLRELASDPEKARQFAEWRKANDYWQAVQEGRAGDTQFSRAAVAEMNTRMQAGELERMQEFNAWMKMQDSAMLHKNDTLKRVLLGPLADNMKGSISRWWQENIATPNYVAHLSQGYKNVYKTLNSYIRYRETLIERMLKEQMPEWYTAAFSDQDAAFGALLKRSVEKYAANSQEQADLYRTLTPAQQRLFDGATKMVAGFLDAELAVDTKDYKDYLITPGAYEKWLADRTAQVQEMKDTGYVPLRRYGDHTVRVYKSIIGKDGKPQQLEVSLEMFTTEREAIMASKVYDDEMKRQGAPYTVEVGFKHKSTRDTTISVQQFLDTARRNGVEVSATERERLVLALSDSGAMIRNRLLHREGMPGYSKDGMRVLNEFGVNMSGKIAYSRFGVAIDSAADGRAVTSDVVDGEPKIEIDQLRGEPGATESAEEYEARNLWRADGPKSGFYRNQADKLSDYVLVPDNTGGWSRNLRGAAMMYFIGGSISGAMVNTMSVPMLLVPELSIHTPYMNAAATSLGAWKMVWQHQAILRDITRLKDVAANPMPSIDNVPGLRAAIIAATDKLHDTELHSIMSISQGQFFSQSRKVQRAIEVWMAPFRISEQTNRITSFISGYKIGVENGLTGPALFTFARDMVDSTQNSYSQANRPGAARNPIFAIAMVFKSFPLFMTEAIALMYKQNPKSAVYMLLGLVALTGVQGLPFAETIEDLIDTIAQRIFNSPFNTRRAMRNVIKSASEAVVGYDMSELVLRGVINDMVGMSVSSRIGAGDFVPGTRLGTADADQGRIFEALAGAPVAMLKDGISNIGKLATGIATGDWQRAAQALREGGPVAIRNAIKGSEQLADGYASDSKGRKIVDISTPAALWQMAGVASADLAKMYELESINVQTKAFYQQASQEMQNQLVRALKAGDTEKVQEISELRSAWNAQYPEMPIMANAASVRRALVLAGVGLDQRSRMLWGRRLGGTNIFTEGQ